LLTKLGRKLFVLLIPANECKRCTHVKHAICVHNMDNCVYPLVAKVGWNNLCVHTIFDIITISEELQLLSETSTLQFGWTDSIGASIGQGEVK
jgi:hypothetical protein